MLTSSNVSPPAIAEGVTLLVVSPSVLLFAVAAGGTVGQLMRRRQAYKAAFNVGQSTPGVDPLPVTIV